MPEFNIPLTKPRQHEYSAKDVNDFFMTIAMIPNDYFENIIDDFCKDYKTPDKEANRLLRGFITNRKERNDAYFGFVTEIHSRFYNGKPLIINKIK